MRSVVMISALVLGLGTVTVARADTQPAVSSQVSVHNTSTEQRPVQPAQGPVLNAGSHHDRALVPVAGERVVARGRRGSYLLNGNAAWFIAGAAGALIPLALFAVPALVLAWFGPFAPLAFLAGIVVATVTTGLGGAVAWGISAIFSDMKSGFLAPVFGAALTGLGATFFAGLLASMVILGGIGVSWLATGQGNNLWDAITPNWNNLFDLRDNPQGPIMVAASAISFLVWGTGVLVASIGGPMVGALLYRSRGTPKYIEEEVVVEPPVRTYEAPATNEGYGTTGRDYDTYPQEAPLPR